MIEIKIFKIWLVIIFLHIVIFPFAFEGIQAKEKQGHVFSTWEGFEPDKCATIWLIKRFIDPDAIIKFFPKGEIIDEGIPFDTPDAKLRRYAKMSTFESFLQQYKIADPKLIYIGKIIHDIEINIWEEKIMAETIFFQSSINKIVIETKDEKKVIKKSNDHFDNLYRKLKYRLQ